MKVTIITITDAPNYGSLLQAFATQKKFEKYSDEVEIVDYVRRKFLLKVKTRLNKDSIRGFAYFISVVRWTYVTQKFKKKWLNMTPVCYKKDEDFKHFPIHDGIYFTGSDQVWNTDWNNGVLPPLYLSFVPNDKRKYAYAASFGKDDFTQSEIDKSYSYINQYKQISVREDIAVKILNNQYGYKNAICIVDPTLAMPKEFWYKYVQPIKIDYDYILVYKLTNDKNFDVYVDALSKITRLKVVRIITKMSQLLMYNNVVMIPHVFQFISFIHNAKYIITDSFHGTAFSLIMNVAPIVLYPNAAAGRIDSLLRLVGIEHRRIIDFNDFDVINRPVDWEQVNTVLAHERERVDEFLSEIFNKKDKGLIDNE